MLRKNLTLFLMGGSDHHSPHANNRAGEAKIPDPSVVAGTSAIVS